MSILASAGFSKNTDSFRAGLESAAMALEEIHEPDMVILFASVELHPVINIPSVIHTSL